MATVAPEDGSGAAAPEQDVEAQEEGEHEKHEGGGPGGVIDPPGPGGVEGVQGLPKRLRIPHGGHGGLLGLLTPHAAGEKGVHVVLDVVGELLTDGGGLPPAPELTGDGITELSAVHGAPPYRSRASGPKITSQPSGAPVGVGERHTSSPSAS